MKFSTTFAMLAVAAAVMTSSIPTAAVKTITSTSTHIPKGGAFTTTISGSVVTVTPSPTATDVSTIPSPSNVSPSTAGPDVTVLPAPVTVDPSTGDPYAGATDLPTGTTDATGTTSATGATGSAGSAGATSATGTTGTNNTASPTSVKSAGAGNSLRDRASPFAVGGVLIALGVILL